MRGCKKDMQKTTPEGVAGGYRPDVIAQRTSPDQNIKHNGPISAIFVFFPSCWFLPV